MPEQFFDLDPVMQQFIPNMKLMDNSFFESAGPGLMRGSALNKLMGMTGSTGTGGIQGFANLSNALNQDNRSNFQGTVQSLMQAFLNNSQKPATAAGTGAPASYYPNAGTEAASNFNQFPWNFG
jgi:hypothetical protein